MTNWKPELVRCGVLVAIALTLCSVSRPADVGRGEFVPFPKLLAELQQYDGKLVSVYGFLRYRHHDMALYPSKDEAEYGFISHGFWVYASTDTKIRSLRKGDAGLFDLDGKHVLLTGSVDTSRHGFKGAYPAALVEVREVLELKRDK